MTVGLQTGDHHLGITPAHAVVPRQPDLDVGIPLRRAPEPGDRETARRDLADRAGMTGERRPAPRHDPLANHDGRMAEAGVDRRSIVRRLHGDLRFKLRHGAAELVGDQFAKHAGSIPVEMRGIDHTVFGSRAQGIAAFWTEPLAEGETAVVQLHERHLLRAGNLADDFGPAVETGNQPSRLGRIVELPSNQRRHEHRHAPLGSHLVHVASQ